MTSRTGSVASRIAIAGLFPRFVAPMGTAPAGRSIPVAGNDTEAPRQAVASVTARRISGFVVHRNRRKTTADVVPGRLPAAPDPYDRKSCVYGKRVSGRLGLGGRRTI